MERGMMGRGGGDGLSDVYTYPMYMEKGRGYTLPVFWKCLELWTTPKSFIYKLNFIRPVDGVSVKSANRSDDKSDCW